MQRLLDQPIHHRRDAKLSHPSVRFRYLYPAAPDCGSISAFKQFFLDALPVRLAGRAFSSSTVIPSTPLLPCSSPPACRPLSCSRVRPPLPSTFARSRQSSLLVLAVTLDAPTPVPRGFRPLPPVWVRASQPYLSASPSSSKFKASCLYFTFGPSAWSICLLWPLLTSVNPSHHLSMPVVPWAD